MAGNEAMETCTVAASRNRRGEWAEVMVWPWQKVQTRGVYLGLASQQGGFGQLAAVLMPDEVTVAAEPSGGGLQRLDAPEAASGSQIWAGTRRREVARGCNIAVCVCVARASCERCAERCLSGADVAASDRAQVLREMRSGAVGEAEDHVRGALVPDNEAQSPRKAPSTARAGDLIARYGTS